MSDNKEKAKLKAKEIVDSYYIIQDYPMDFSFAKQCAIIHIKGIIEEKECMTICYDWDRPIWTDRIKFWQQVKEEIEAL